MPTTTTITTTTSLFFTILIFSTPPISSSTPTTTRRALHQPFFPLLSTPTSATAQPPPPPPPPFASATATATARPFFPVTPSPPPPPPQPSLPTFPANLSALSAPAPHHPHRLSPLIALSATALAVLLLALALLLLYRHRHRRSTDSDGHRLFPPNATASDGRKLSASSSPAAASEFLYLGTLVSSRGRSDDAPSSATATATAAASSPYRKLGSPELHPLPPLARHVRHDHNEGCSSDEEFYSPSVGSPAEKASPAGGFAPSSSQKGKCGSPISTLSSPSYPSSNLVSSPSPSSSPLISSSPGRSTIKSQSSAGTGFRPPPPLAPPRLVRPLTPPKRKPFPISPPERDVDSRVSGSSVRNLHSPASIGDFTRNPFGSDPSPPPQRPPPPPPPPLAPKMMSLLPPRPTGAKNSTAAVYPAESPENSDTAETGEENYGRPKLKPLHWDKVRASSDRAMVWDQLKSSSFELNEEMIAALFVCKATKETVRRQVSPPPGQENRVLDPKKSQNIAILLRALNVTKEEVCEALLEGNTDGLGNELLETLLKMAPSKEEEFKLKEYKDDSPFKLGPAEKFLKAVLDIPFAFKRVEAMLYIANFESEIHYLRKSFETLQAACEELRSSRLFLKLLEAVLKTGNRMNVGTNRGDAQAFKLDTLLKLVDVKGTDGKTTLLHFVVQEIIKAEGARFSIADSSINKTHAGTLRDDLECKRLGLQVVSGLGSELSNVKKAATMDSDVLTSYVSKLSGGIGKISEVLRLNIGLSLKEKSQRFHNSMSDFLKNAEVEIIKLQAEESFAMTRVKEITVYFHGDSAKEEAHPFRIFMVIRDFLGILDQVCKEVGRINERTTVSSAHHVPALANLTQPPVFPRLHTPRSGSSDDESSSSS